MLILGAAEKKRLQRVNEKSEKEDVHIQLVVADIALLDC
jgi:hypothetical protein